MKNTISVNCKIKNNTNSSKNTSYQQISPLARKILAFHFERMPTSILGQLCFDLFESGLESDEICYFAGYANDVDRCAIECAIESTLVKYAIKMPSYGEEYGLCLFWYCVETYDIDFDKLSLEALRKIANCFIGYFDFDEPLEEINSCETYFQIPSLMRNINLSEYYYRDINEDSLLEHIDFLKEMYGLSLSQPYFKQFLITTS